ncbi:MAG: sugar ABC transporter permease [Clostridiales bacterium]|nr:sugar ABC transporter permease [Clostridiales bacterium]
MSQVTLKNTWPLHLMLLPCIIMMLIFNTRPLFQGVRIAMLNYKPALGFEKSAYVGLDNFKFIFELPTTATLLRNTVVMAVGKILLRQFLAIMYALMLHEMANRRWERISQTIVYLPHFLSWVILGVVVRTILANDGPVNNILTGLGLTQSPIGFITSNHYFQGTMIVTDAWKEFGYAAVIYIATLAGVNPELYEAASIDGASRFQRTRYITLPSISTTIMLVMALQIGGILNAGFDQIFNMYTPAVYETGDVLDTYVYRMGFQSAQYSISTAIGFMTGIVGMVLTLISNFLASKFGNRRLF